MLNVGLMNAGSRGLCISRRGGLHYKSTRAVGKPELYSSAAIRGVASMAISLNHSVMLVSNCS